jgi:putative DNA primase/helicase
VACPVHGGKDGFRLFPNAAETGGGVCNTCGTFPDGFKVLGWATGRPLSEIMTAVANACTDNSTEPGHGNQAEAPEDDTPEERERRRRKIEMTWSETVPDPGRIAQYLRHRKLSGRVPEVLRFHRALGYFERGPDGHLRHLGDFPTIVAPVQSADGEIVAPLRTYLDPGGSGKAGVPSPKKLTPAIRPGATKGAAIRLAPAGETLAITEGIEIGIAVVEATRLPVWAAVSAGASSLFKSQPRSAACCSGRTTTRPWRGSGPPRRPPRDSSPKDAPSRFCSLRKREATGLMS